MFVRRKIIKGNPYGYLVENSWTDDGPRQKVVKYLGRIHDCNEKPPADLTQVADDEILETVVAHEIPQEVQVDFSKRTVTKDGKRIVLGVNGGILCDETLAAVFKGLHQRNEERPGIALAKALKDAGLRIHQQDFIRLYLSVRS